MKARDILTGPETWIQGTQARDADGEPVQPTGPTAVRFCLLGAVNRAYQKEGTEVVNDVIDRLNDELRLSKPYLVGFINYNDAPGRMFAEVKALVDRLDI